MSFSNRLRLGAAAIATGTIAVTAALSLAGQANASTVAATPKAAAATTYTFATLDNAKDLTFNQLLGINSHNVISGYFGIGSATHPNKGYLLKPPYGQANYVNENFPGSTMTQVTGLNDLGDTSGFWVSGNNTNRGFVEWNGVFVSYTDPSTPHVAGSVNQLLGINNAGIAVGFYDDAAVPTPHAHPYELNQATGKFTALHIPDAVSATASGINNAGDIVGFFTDAAGSTESFLLTPSHQLVTYQFPGGSDTQALGINANDQIVGSYLDGNGVMHGFVLSDPLGPVSHWQKIDDPHGIGSTVVNGINKAGDLVGFYTDSAGNVDGMLAVPAP
jgi:probable HAF family extracellular repeat protein